MGVEAGWVAGAGRKWLQRERDGGGSKITIGKENHGGMVETTERKVAGKPEDASHSCPARQDHQHSRQSYMQPQQIHLLILYVESYRYS